MDSIAVAGGQVQVKKDEQEGKPVMADISSVPH